MRLVVSMVVLLLGPSALVGQQAGFTVVSAYHEGTSLRFQLPPQTEWDWMVPEELGAIPIPTSDPAVVADLLPQLDDYGSAEVRTAVPVPDILAGQHLYFAGPSGIRPMVTDSAAATTHFTFNSAHDRIVNRAIRGEIYGSTPTRPGVRGGGFALYAEAPIEFKVQPASVTADDLLLGGATARPDPDGGYWGRGTAFWEVAAQYRFRTSDPRFTWIFVQWQPDRELFEAGCEYRYSLFRMDGSDEPPVQVAWTSYGCDV